MEGQREHAFEYRLLTEKKKSTTERERHRKREGNREEESRVLFQKDTESKDGHINREKKNRRGQNLPMHSPRRL
jgi:hypothetical protein